MYRAHTIDGHIREGVIQALDLDEATRSLVRSKLVPEWVKPAKKIRGVTLSFGGRAKPMSLALFARQFATLIDAAVPMVHSLEICQDLAEDRPLRKALGQVSIDVQAGNDLASAMKEHPGVFNDIFVNMVEAGEQGGVLDSILNRLATYLEKSEKLKSRVKSALIYPAIIFAVAILASTVMLIFVVPTFQGMFDAGGMSLPYPTQVLINLSRFMTGNWHLLLAGAFGGAVAIKRIYATSSGQKAIDGIMLRIPILGDVIRKAAVARFAQSMASLLTAGANLIDAIISSAATTGNVVIEKAILRTRHAIEAGQGISKPLEESGHMPQLVSRMVEVGEQTGRLDDMFEKVAIFYEGEVETAVDRLMKALEPALIVVVGFILGGMVVALYLPIFDALTQVGV
jgi:type IV pilus assembly protein PilC